MYTICFAVYCNLNTEDHNCRITTWNKCNTSVGISDTTPVQCFTHTDCVISQLNP